MARDYNGPKYVVVTGGVISGVGKGLTTASMGKILQQYGYSTTAVKIDPYINYDAGTMRPTEHGEVWVTDEWRRNRSGFGQLRSASWGWICRVPTT